MAGVDEPIHVDRAGPREDLHSNLEAAGDAPEVIERDPAHEAALDPGHGRPGHAGTIGQVVLPPPTSDPSEPDQPPEGDVIHPREA